MAYLRKARLECLASVGVRAERVGFCDSATAAAGRSRSRSSSGTVQDVTDKKTMVRTELSINGRSFFLAQGQDAHEVQRRIEAAVDSRGVFVTFTVVGNREVSVLITPRSQVIFTIETVAFDERDTGDSDFPFGGFYD